jgi:hypothetical protein
MVEFLNFAQDLDRRHGVRSCTGYAAFLRCLRRENFRWADLVQRNLNEEKMITTSITFYHVSNSGCCGLMARYCHITILLPSDAALCSHEGQEEQALGAPLVTLKPGEECELSAGLPRTDPHETDAEAS